MSSTSTNKQPLLIDRPMHEFAILGDVACVAIPTDYAGVVGGGLTLLVDCFGGEHSDGALVDSVSIVANQAGTTPSAVLLYLSVAPSELGVSRANTALAASAVIGSAAAGERTGLSLPPLCVPVPDLGAQSAVTEFSKKNTGLYVPSGMGLYVGVNAIITAPSPLTRVTVFAQGGYF